jgi:hypothetical protein
MSGAAAQGQPLRVERSVDALERLDIALMVIDHVNEFVFKVVVPSL